MRYLMALFLLLMLACGSEPTGPQEAKDKNMVKVSAVRETMTIIDQGQAEELETFKATHTDASCNPTHVKFIGGRTWIYYECSWTRYVKD